MKRYIINDKENIGKFKWWSETKHNPLTKDEIVERFWEYAQQQHFKLKKNQITFDLLRKLYGCEFIEAKKREPLWNTGYLIMDVYDKFEWVEFYRPSFYLTNPGYNSKDYKDAEQLFMQTSPDDCHRFGIWRFDLDDGELNDLRILQADENHPEKITNFLSKIYEQARLKLI